MVAPRLSVLKREVKKTWGYVAIAIVLAFFLLAGLAVPTAQWLWFKEDAGYLRMFTLQYTARAELFSIVLIPTLVSLWIAFSGFRGQQAVYSLDAEPSSHQLSQLVSYLQDKGEMIAKWATFIFGILFAEGFSSSYNDYLVSNHAASFGMKDPIFGLDLSFFAFKLPWYQDLVTYALSIIFFSLVVAGIIFGAKFALSKTLSVRFAGKSSDHVFLFGGLLFLGLAVQALLSIYGSLNQIGDIFVGPDMAGMVQLRLSFGTVILLALGGIYLLTQIRKGAIAKPFIVAAIPAAIWFVVAVQIVPYLVLKLRVDPDKINAELPYAARALTYTKFAYGLSSVQVEDTSINPDPSGQEVSDASSTFQNMRLWDPEVLQSALQATQSLRPYYMFNDVDVDRYQLPNDAGKLEEKLVMISPRDVYLPGLSPEAQTWVNSRLGYTHGYGIVMAEVNKSTAMGQPVLIAKDIPQTSIPELPITQPRLYFSDFSHADGTPADEYAVVDTKSPEIDFPTQQGQATFKWTGDRGILLDSFFRKFLFAYVLGDWNILISTNMKPTSRLLWKRNISLRAQAVYPFLKFDSDPYIVADGGNIYWIMDGYTTSSQIPYSQVTGFHGENVNYIRNSVKVVINAYTGQMVAYEMDGKDPVLKTYESIYPGLIHPLSEVPAGLVAHFRYPEELFNAQSDVLTLYHVDKATTFLENSDAWSVANERGLDGDKSRMPAYYVLMRLPEAPRDEFLLILPFTPLGRDNMTGWLAAHCDPGHYGQLTLYKFPKGDLIPGPAQEELLFVQDKTIAEINRNLNNDQSKIIVGNLLVIPVGKSLVYSETLFLQGRTSGIQSIPELKKVILATQSKIVVADSYAQALQQLFGQSSSAVSNPTQNSAPVQKPRSGNPPASGNQNPSREAIQSAADQLDAAQKALTNGDLAGYANDVKRAGEILKKALNK